MSKLDHTMCDSCWEKKQPNREPVRLTISLKPLPCCFCGEPTQSGIFVRAHPTVVKCRGKGKYHEEWHDDKN